MKDREEGRLSTGERTRRPARPEAGEPEGGLDGKSVRWPGRLAVYAGLAVCAGLAVLARGYGFGIVDQWLYLPFIYHWNHPALFAHDYLLQLSFAREGATWTLLALLARLIPIRALFLVLYLLISYGVLYWVYKLAEGWWKSTGAAWTAVLLWIPAYTVPGVANTTFDAYLSTRIVGTFFGLAALYWYLKRKNAASGAALFCGGLFHIISILPLAAGLGFCSLVSKRWKALSTTVSFFAAAVMGDLAIGLYFGLHQNLFQRYDPFWFRIVSSIDREAIPLHWPVQAWVQLGFYLAAGAGFLLWRRKRGALEAWTRDSALVGGGITLLAALALLGTAFKWTFAVQICAFRGVLFIMCLLAAAVAGPISKAVEKNGWWGAALAGWAAGCWMMGTWKVQWLAAAALLAAAAVAGLQQGEGLHGFSLLRGVYRRYRRVLAVLLVAVFVLMAADLFVFYKTDISLPRFLPGRQELLLPLLMAAGSAAVSLLAVKKLRSRLAAAAMAAAFGAMVFLEPSAWLLGRLVAVPAFRSAYMRARPAAVLNSELRRRNERKMADLMREIRQKVPKDATVIVPPEWGDFRLMAFRSSFLTFKDGAPVLYYRPYAMEWYRRARAVGALSREGGSGRIVLRPGLNLDVNQIRSLAVRYKRIHLDYLFTKRDLPFPVIASGAHYRLYDIRTESGTKPGDIS